MLKFLQITGLILIGVLFTEVGWLFGEIADVKVIIPLVIAYLSFLSLIFLKDKTEWTTRLTSWFWNSIYATKGRAAACDLAILILIILAFLLRPKEKPNAYLYVYEKETKNVLTGQEVLLSNTLDSTQTLRINTGTTGISAFHIAIPSWWRKIYNGYIYPPDVADKAIYNFSIDAANYQNDGVKIKTGQPILANVDTLTAKQFERSIHPPSRGIASETRFKLLFHGEIAMTGYVPRHGFFVNYNELLKVANSVQFVLKSCGPHDTHRRETVFRKDTLLESASPTAYSNSGFDRGNLVAYSDMACYGPEAQRDAYLTSAIAPQAPRMNRLAWVKLEEYTRAQAIDSIYVIAGTLFLKKDSLGKPVIFSIGPEKIAVPTHFYRIISRYRNGQLQSLAFIVPNTNEADPDFRKYQVSLTEIETATGIHFFKDSIFVMGQNKNEKPLLW